VGLAVLGDVLARTTFATRCLSASTALLASPLGIVGEAEDVFSATYARLPRTAVLVSVLVEIAVAPMTLLGPRVGPPLPFQALR
jgi:hypothetical protein